MRRAILLLAAIAVALVLVGGTSLADSEVGVKGTTAVKPSKTKAAPPPTEGLSALPPVEDGKIKPQKGSSQGSTSQRGLSATAASTPMWLDGTTSNTHFYNFITESYMMLTTQWVGYWGTEDLSYPKTGELYYGRAVIANVGTISTKVVPNVQLPPDTHFNIDPNNPNSRVLCYLWDFNANTTTELTGTNCDQQPSQGLYGAQFAPESGTWSLSPGKAVIVIFPIFSTAELKGIAATPADCLIGSTFAAGSFEVWDAPEVGDTCPLPSGHGTWQGVFVPFNPPTISYPSPSATNITTTGARTTANLFSHFDPGTAFVELGTTTSYGQTSSVAVPNTQDSFIVNTDWSNLEPGTTYHWRLRFVDTKGRTFTGPDQTFKTAADTMAPGPPVISSPANNSYDLDGTIAFKGTAEAGSTVRLFEGTALKATATAGTTGAWSKTLTGVANGRHAYTAKATDKANNTSAASAPKTVTVDKVRPNVLGTSPLAGATGISPTANVTATFSEAMNANTLRDPTTLRSTTFRLARKNPDGTTTAVVAKVSYSVTTNPTTGAKVYRATLNPDANLELGKTYAATVTSGAKDVAGHALDQNPTLAGNQSKVWSFKVRS